MFDTLPRRKVANPDGNHLRQLVTACHDLVFLDWLLLACDFVIVLTVDNMQRVVENGSVHKEGVCRVLEFDVHVLPVLRGHVRIEIEGLVFGIEPVDGPLELACEICDLLAFFKVQNAVDEIGHDLLLFEHLAECRTVARMQEFLPFQAIWNYDIAVLYGHSISL